MKLGWRSDQVWVARYHEQIRDILQRCAIRMVAIELACWEKDTKQATDFVVRSLDGDVAVRIRRHDCRKRDLTIRAMRASGQETELSKIKKGFGRWYLYCWTDRDSITEWILVDLNRLRATGLMDQGIEDDQQQPVIMNADGGSGFIAIPSHRLAMAGCLVASQIMSVGVR